MQSNFHIIAVSKGLANISCTSASESSGCTDLITSAMQCPVQWDGMLRCQPMTKETTACGLRPTCGELVKHEGSQPSNREVLCPYGGVYHFLSSGDSPLALKSNHIPAVTKPSPAPSHQWRQSLQHPRNGYSEAVSFFFVNTNSQKGKERDNRKIKKLKLDCSCRRQDESWIVEHLRSFLCAARARSARRWSWPAAERRNASWAEESH